MILKNVFMNMIALSELFKGFIILNLILSPLTLLITLYYIYYAQQVSHSV